MRVFLCWREYQALDALLVHGSSCAWGLADQNSFEIPRIREFATSPIVRNPASPLSLYYAKTGIFPRLPLLRSLIPTSRCALSWYKEELFSLKPGSRDNHSEKTQKLEGSESAIAFWDFMFHSRPPGQQAEE